jgi:hypothetical protein
MKRISRISKILAAGAGFLVGSVTVVSAGVVMSETATALGPLSNGIQHRTIYVQGHKERVDIDGLQTITDLDQHRIYIIDEAHKNYVEIPLNTLSQNDAGNAAAGGAAIELKRTGGTRVIAAHSCEEYRGRQSNAELQITVSTCVSTSAPGAEEIARFDQAMLDQVEGKSKTSSEGAAGVVLEKKSELKVRVPGAARQSTSLVTSTKVNAIKVTRLAAQTFTPPKGYSKIDKVPPRDQQENPPGNLPDSLESVMFMGAGAHALQQGPRI